MKKNSFNQFNSLKFKLLTFNNKFVFTIQKKIILLLFLLFGITISAQVSSTNNALPRIQEIHYFLANLRNSNQNLRTSTPMTSRLEHLLNDIQPSVYINLETVKTYGEKPNSLFIDINSLSLLSDSAPFINTIEIVTIKINNSHDLNSIIDLSQFINYKKLKYIYILFDVECSEVQINSMVQNNDPKYGIFYRIDKGDNNQ